MSKFNTATICSACKERERIHPDYAAADAAEVAAVRAGIRNFPGVGCPHELHFLPCLAEQWAIATKNQTHAEKRLQALEKATLDGQTDDGAERFCFSDGSIALLRPNGAVPITMLRYPPR